MKSHSPTVGADPDPPGPGASSAMWIRWVHIGVIVFFFIKWVANSGLNPGEMVMPTHDFLDSYPGWYAALKTTGTFFASPGAEVPSIFDGLPRSCLKSSLKLDMLAYYLLSFPWAYSINLLASWLTAYASFILLSREIAGKESPPLAGIAAGLVFASLPFYPGGPYTPAAVCLALRAAIRMLQNRPSIFDFCALFLVSFLTPIVLGTYMILFFLGIFMLAALLLRRYRAALLLAAGLGIACIGTMVSEVYLFSELLQGWSFEPNRIETKFAGKPLNLDRILDYWINGQYHAPTFARPFLLLLVGLGGAASLITRAPVWRRLLALVAISVAIAAGAVVFEYMRPRLDADSLIASTLRTFNLARLTATLPLVWSLSALLALVGLSVRRPAFLAGLGLALLHAFSLMGQTSYTDNPKWNMVYNDFYMPRLFECVDAALPADKSTYRVVSIGLQPSISQAHGFYTLDGYVGLYPLEFKKRFRPIIAAELEKSPDLRSHFDNWGSRVFVFSSELGRNYMVRRKEAITLKELAVRTDLLFKYGVRYVLSSVQIGNAAQLGLDPILHCEDSARPIELFVYSVRAHAEPVDTEAVGIAEVMNVTENTDISSREKNKAVLPE